MPDIRLVAMDLDGTLLRSDKTLSPRTVEVLQSCEARGVKLALASGRGFESARVYARLAEINGPIVCANGARVEETPFGPTIYEDFLPEQVSRDVCRILLESGIYFVCYGRGVNYTANGTTIRRGLMPAFASDNGRFTVRNVIDVDEMLSVGVKAPYKYVAFSDDTEALSRLRERLAADTDCELMSSWPDNVEVMAKGAGKGKAIRLLAERYGFSREQVMAFGDQTNDKDMLEYAGWPVAMKNAARELKSLARIIAPGNDEDGVAETLLREVLPGAEDRVLKGGV